MRWIYIQLLILLFIVLLTLTKSQTNSEKNNLKNKNKVKKRNTNFTKRKLDFTNGHFVDLKLHFDLKNFEKNFPEHWTNDNKNLFINAMNKAAGILESFLSIFKGNEEFKIIFKNEYTSDYDIEDYDRTVFALNEEPYNFNIGIFFNFKETRNTPASTEIITTNHIEIPLFAVIKLNKDYLDSKLQSDYLEALMLHELTHALGFTEDIFTNDNYIDNIIMSKEIDHKVHYYIKSPKVVEFAQNYFNCLTLDGVEIEKNEDGGPGSHWSSRILLGEYMTDFSYSEEQAISGFTLALLEDLGYLKVKNKYTGGLMRFGKGKGCNFLSDKCIDSTHYDNEFYYPTEINLDKKEPSCSSGRQSKTFYKLISYEEGTIPEEYIYFSGYNNYGGLSSANYCPVSLYESPTTIYEGRCSQKGTPSNLASIIGESHSDISFCALSSLVKTNYEEYSEEVRAVCFKMYCSEESLTIQVGEDYFVCPRYGGKIIGEGYSGYLLCPDYNLICTSTVVCNDMFSCLSKKSEEKPNTYTYDYTIKTTQEFTIYNTIGNDIGHELSDNGNTCPLYCSQCNKNKECVKCGNNYILKDKKCEERVKNCVLYNADFSCKKCKDNYELVKGRDNEIICLKRSDLGNQYYQVVEGDTTYYIKCSDSIENCYSCSSSSSCTKCLNNYAIINNDNAHCVDLSDKKYYFDNEEDKYKLCSEKIEGCDTCTKDSNNVLNCIECQSTYAFVHGNPDKCSLKATIETDDSVFSDNEGNYFSCSDSRYHSVEKCLNCRNKEYCELCQNDYSLFNSKKLCLSDSDINEKNYYYDPIDNTYYLCSKKLQGCKRCNDGNNCIECNNEYGIDENNKCVHLSVALLRYYLDPYSGKYIKCSKINNCEECSSSSECTKCQNGYKLNNNACEIIENYNNDNYKGLAIGAIILSIISMISVGVLLFILFRKGMFTKKNVNNSNKTEDDNENDKINDQNEINILPNKRSIHNEAKK